MNRRAVTIFGGLVVALAGINGLVLHKEGVITSGTPVFLELAPVDPRSLIQGDYMQLDYAIARELRRTKDLPTDGYIVLQLDERGVGSFLRLHDGGELVAPNELLLRFRTREGQTRVGSGAFFFQEGHARYYDGAEYGEIRVADSGTSVLIGLADENLKTIRPEDSPTR